MIKRISSLALKGIALATRRCGCIANTQFFNQSVRDRYACIRVSYPSARINTEVRTFINKKIGK